MTAHCKPQVDYADWLALEIAADALSHRRTLEEVRIRGGAMIRAYRNRRLESSWLDDDWTDVRQYGERV